MLYLRVFRRSCTLNSTTHTAFSGDRILRIALVPLNVCDAVVANEDRQGGRLSVSAGWADAARSGAGRVQ